MPLVRGGNARAIAVSSLRRVPVIPEVPTVEEQGFPGFEMNEWNGLLLSAGPPAPVLRTLHAAVRHAVADPVVRERVAAMGAVLEGTGPEEFAAYLEARRPAIARLVREERITAE